MQLSNQYQQEVLNKLNGHPVLYLFRATFIGPLIFRFAPLLNRRSRNSCCCRGLFPSADEPREQRAPSLAPLALGVAAVHANSKSLEL